jgi:DNA end-binding protein Ku
MRPIWTGAISFGLVNIPVKLFSATEDSSLNLDMLDSRDHSNIKFKRVNEKTGKEVPYAQITKGYLYKDKYVVLDEADFKSADAKKTQLIEIISFADEREIDPIYFEQPYYLAPDKSGAKAYALLREALQSSSKVGVTSFVMRNKEALAILKPYGNVIILNRIRFEQEIRETADLNLPAIAKGKSKELDMAEKLIDQLTEKFDISAYKDTYTEKLLKTIALKAKSPAKKTKQKPMEIVYKKTEDDDLMNMLKASLGGTKKRKAS